MVKRVRGLAIGTGVTIGLLALAIWASRRSGAGNFIIDGLRGFGENVGRGITAPLTGIVSGVSEGAGELGNEALTRGADFQQFLTGNRNAISDFITQSTQNVLPTASGASRTRGPASRTNPATPIDFSQVTQRVRELTQRGSQSFSSPAGGFGTVEAQTTALERERARVREQFPEFFQ